MPTRKGAIKDLAELQSKLNHVINEIMEPGMRVESEPSFSWAPPTDISEDETTFIVEMELPGMEIADLEISCKEKTVKVSGDRKAFKELVPKNVQRMERFFGHFSREFDFPLSIEPSKVEASLKEGILTLILPKKNDKKKIVIR